MPTAFPDAALDEAAALPEQPSKADFAGRRDLRNLPFVTIDGATARDFDDAIYVEKRGKGYRLRVAIADVSHYVRPGSALDEEAYERGNSYYFPLSVEPMFPERLSNGLCSLNPDVPRLVMVVSIDYSGRGEPAEAEYFPAVFRSHARLTYDQVKAALLDKDPREQEPIRHVMPMLETAEELARKIQARRRERGSLDFDLPEPDIRLGPDNEILELRPRERHFAHQLIEEFMVAANEAVARFLESAGPGCLYRVHPRPDNEKLERLGKVLQRTSPELKLPARPSTGDLQELLRKAEQSDWSFLVNRLLLRSMMQAQYNPENEGHFGLASESYCHFTSPIRRYADLVVHRLLKSALGDTSQPSPNRKRLRDAADRVNSRERRGVDAEREINRRVVILHLRDRLDERFKGVVSSVTDWGFRVELLGGLAEGTVRLSSLNDGLLFLLARQRNACGRAHRANVPAGPGSGGRTGGRASRRAGSGPQADRWGFDSIRFTAISARALISGLAIWPSAPTLSPLCCSASVISEEKSITGNARRNGSSLIFLHRVWPSMAGISMSDTTTSYQSRMLWPSADAWVLAAWSVSHASCPLCVTMTSKPARVRTVCMSLRMDSESSATRARY